MATVPYNNNLPSSFDLARRDDFFGFGNAMQAIESITPQNSGAAGYGTGSQPNQIITTVTSGSLPPEAILASSGGTFFDVRPPNEIFAELDARLNRQREQIYNSPQLLNMLQNSRK